MKRDFVESDSKVESPKKKLSGPGERNEERWSHRPVELVSNSDLKHRDNVLVGQESVEEPVEKLESLLRVAFSVLKGILRGGDLVRHVAPDVPPLERYEFEDLNARRGPNNWIL